MIAVTVLSVVLGLMAAGFAWFYWYSRTPAWGDSEVRKSILNMLVVVGPIFGMHYRPPRPEPTTISAPGSEPVPPRPGVIIPPTDDDGGSPS